jgi:glycosyltransferase involved in cell wall biosynthesis
MLSIILPTQNEMRSGLLGPIVSSLTQVQDAEIIVVDGGSDDGTLELLSKFDVKLIAAPGASRAAKLNAGIAAASGEMIFLHHPRSLVQPEGFLQLADVGKEMARVWGGLSHQFDDDHPLLRFTSWYSNRIRCDRSSILYLDHCIFFDRGFKDEGLKIPDVDIFEDTELSKLLRRHSRPVRLSVVARTSAVRFKRNGIYRQALLNQWMKLAYYLNFSHDKMNRLYEKGLNLNKK